MNKIKLKKIYKELSRLKKKDEKVNKALLNFLDIVSPESANYSFVEKDSFYWAMEILTTIYGGFFADDVLYWFYECEEGKKDNPLSGTIGKTSYKFDTLDRYFDFLVDLKHLEEYETR